MGVVKGVPLGQERARLDRLSVLDLQMGAVNDLVAFPLAALLADDGQFALAAHGDQFAPIWRARWPG